MARSFNTQSKAQAQHTRNKIFHKSYKEVSGIVDDNLATVISESTIFRRSKDSVDKGTAKLIKPNNDLAPVQENSQLQATVDKTNGSNHVSMEANSTLAISPEVDPVHFGQQSTTMKTTTVMSKTATVMSKPVGQYDFSSLSFSPNHVP